ncbi:autotransporter outer membrane beta-barrel domain-containing protein [Brucella intermedia]|uniref:autotransporter outer membrane beta-barrel domain-containing protein n=1 Tax=Brucella intermedia TaxID=94625 RepID=UPI0023609378|nr:autotransporter outer membrane beta-barrel domain-containing protein [Brucella intermedia]
MARTVWLKYSAIFAILSADPTKATDYGSVVISSSNNPFNLVGGDNVTGVGTTFPAVRDAVVGSILNVSPGLVGSVATITAQYTAIQNAIGFSMNGSSANFGTDTAIASNGQGISFTVGTNQHLNFASGTTSITSQQSAINMTSRAGSQFTIGPDATLRARAPTNANVVTINSPTAVFTLAPGGIFETSQTTAGLGSTAGFRLQGANGTFGDASGAGVATYKYSGLGGSGLSIGYGSSTEGVASTVLTMKGNSVADIQLNNPSPTSKNFAAVEIGQGAQLNMEAGALLTVDMNIANLAAADGQNAGLRIRSDAFVPGVSALSAAASSTISVTTRNAYNHGLYASGYTGAGTTYAPKLAVVDLSGQATITTSGDNSDAAYIASNTQTYFGDRVTLTTTGDNSNGLRLYNNNLQTDSNGVTPDDVLAQIEGSHIETSGRESASILVYGYQVTCDFTTSTPCRTGGSRLEMTGGSIATHGALSGGAVAWNPTGIENYASHLGFDGTSIRTEGAGSAALYAYGIGSSIRLNNGTIETLGTGSHGLVVADGARVDAANTPVTTLATGAHSLLLTSDDLLLTQTATLNGGSLRSGAGGTVAVVGGNADVRISGATVAGAVNWLEVGGFSGSGFSEVVVSRVGLPTIPNEVIGEAPDPDNGTTPGITPADGLLPLRVDPRLVNVPAVAKINISGSTLTGAAVTDAGSTSNTTLIDSFWTMTGSSNFTTLLNSASEIDYTVPTGNPESLASYKTLTVGNYTGANGTLAVNTWLEADGAPSDILHVTSDTAGNSFLRVRNTGGPGALTQDNGILVVQVDGQSNGDFSLIGDYELEGQQVVVGGAYAYSLWKNGISTPHDGNWYLRSTLSVQPGPGPAPEPEPEPIYQAGDPIYEAYSRALLGLMEMPTLQQRVGNRYWSGPGALQIAQGDGPGTELPPSPEKENIIQENGVWGRIVGFQLTIDPDRSTTGAHSKLDIFKLQAGIDGLLHEDEVGKLIGGITAHYGHGRSRIASFYGDGKIDTNAYGFGATLTWYGHEGFYIDAQGEASWFDSDLSSLLANRPLTDGNKGFGYALSIDTGKRLYRDYDWTLTPQAQLVYSSVDFDDFTDTFGAPVSLDRSNSLRGRLGLSVDRERAWVDDDGFINRLHGYGIANLYYEFLGDRRVDVAETAFLNHDERFWGGLGLGFSRNWEDDKYSVYGEGLVTTSMQNFGDSYSLKGVLGVRVRF